MDPIGVAQAIVDDDTNYDFDEVVQKESTEGVTWRIIVSGEWGGDFQEIFHIHVKKSDGELLFWRNLNIKTGGAIGKEFHSNYWIESD